MLHPDAVLHYINPEIGFGLIAGRFIPKGTITWAMCALEQVFEPDDYAHMPAVNQPYLEKYTYTTNAGKRVLCCDHGRFINHSCEPNTLTLPDTEVEIAIRDIYPGEQITDDYGTLNLSYELPCLCGSENCRGSVRGDDQTRYHEQWEEQVRLALLKSSKLVQPLRSLLEWNKKLQKTPLIA